MSTKYPPRESQYTYDICECGHTRYSHRHLTKYLWIVGRHETIRHCHQCVCHMFKYEKTHHLIFADTKYIGEDYTVDEEKLSK